ncbi:MAG: YaiI/YqxD family protein [Peptococcaceae bacterium]|nr:YaiI/YqxD family protein [Peptococcaceae bacterium]
MRILIDADACPVVDIAIDIAKEYRLECILLCDTAHYFNREGARTVVLGQGADSVDFALVNMVQNGDIVITQDYGLAAMCLARKSAVLNQNGMVYHDGNMDSLLASRHMGQKIRRSGGRTKGPAKRKKEQDEMFANQLRKLILSGITNGIDITADSAE